MDINKDEVCIFIPVINESPTIDWIVRDFKELGYKHILVMDGNSSDDTVEKAEKAGAVVRVQSGKGKGQAIIEGIDYIEQPYMLMLDGDGTNMPEDAENMLLPLFNGADQVIGNRLNNFEPGALSRLNKFGNEIINYLFRVAHGQHLSDILSGYRGFKTESIRALDLKEEGFEIETEMAVEALANRQKIVIVETTYKPRPGTPTKLHPIRDGAKIITALWRLARVSNPIFYFGFIGLILLILGVISGTYVTLEWFKHIVHTELAVLTVLLITLGFQMFMFGVIADMIVSFKMDLKKEIAGLKSCQETYHNSIDEKIRQH